MSFPLVLDVSNNDPISEQLFRRSGAVALICKATEGTTFQDKTLAQHREVARNAGVPFGSYLFLHPSSNQSEAEYYLAYAKPKPGDLQPIIDCEVTDGFTMDAVAKRCQACSEALTKAGYNPILYSSASFLKELYLYQPRLKGLRAWEAQYPGTFTSWSARLAKLRYRLQNGVTVAMWQWTSTELVGGTKYDASVLLAPLSSLLIPEPAV